MFNRYIEELPWGSCSCFSIADIACKVWIRHNCIFLNFLFGTWHTLEVLSSCINWLNLSFFSPSFSVWGMYGDRAGLGAAAAVCGSDTRVWTNLAETVTQPQCTTPNIHRSVTGQDIPLPLLLCSQTARVLIKASYLFRRSPAPSDENIQKVLHKSADSRYGEQTGLSDIKGQVWAAEALPGLVPKTGGLNCVLLVTVSIPLALWISTHCWCVHGEQMVSRHAVVGIWQENSPSHAVSVCFQYLSTPESQSLRCDLIRYICACIHPSNEVLCSDIIPRWAVIGWLLTTCTVSNCSNFKCLTHKLMVMEGGRTVIAFVIIPAVKRSSFQCQVVAILWLAVLWQWQR